MLANVRNNVIGSHHETLLRTPFGLKPFVYCDSTASGKGLKSIEDYLTESVMPFYANTHTLQSSAGRKTMTCRNDARQIIKRVMGCEEEKDTVIFVGSGSTAAANLLISKLKVKEIRKFAKLRKKAKEYIPDANLPAFLASQMSAELQTKRYCERLAWNSFKCTLCNIRVEGLQLFCKHAKKD